MPATVALPDIVAVAADTVPDIVACVAVRVPDTAAVPPSFTVKRFDPLPTFSTKIGADPVLPVSTLMPNAPMPLFADRVEITPVSVSVNDTVGFELEIFELRAAPVDLM